MYTFFIEIESMKNFYVFERSFGLLWQRKHHLQEEDLDQLQKRRKCQIKI